MSDNKRIAKNSLMLYVKLLVSTFVGLFTTRLVLKELGADDYGLYSVVGGVISMMGFLTSTLAATTYRFVAVEMGKGSTDKINKIFNSSFIIFILIGFLLVAIGETIGVWYVKNHLNIEADRVEDALFVLHFVIASTFLSVVSISYQGLITAHENFLVRVSIEIITSLLRLGFLILLIYYVGNKLRAYAVIMMIVMLVPSLLYFIYCRFYYFEEVRWKINRDIEVYREMLGFSSWMVFGSFARMTENQGGKIIINLFFGTIVNAALGVASQIYSYLTIFVQNVSQAAVPQIMKSQGAGDNVRTVNLVYSVNKYSYFILLCISTPIILSIDPILEFWLTDVPQYTRQFAILMLINGLISVSGTSLGGAIQATGKIRVNQIFSSAFILLTLPLTYLLFKLGYPPYFLTVAIIIISIFIRMLRAWVLSNLINEFVLKDDFKKVILPAIIVTIAILPLYYLRPYYGNSLYSIILFSIFSIIYTSLFIYFIGLNVNERKVVKKNIIKYSEGIISKIKNN